VHGIITQSKGDFLATFEDASPAILACPIEKGRVVHFAWMPGLSYWKSATRARDRLGVAFSEAVRNWIVYPTELAKVRAPIMIDHAMVETPLLLSEQGAAVTLLNWGGEPKQQVKLTLRLPFPVRLVQSVSRGQLPFEKSGDAVRFSLPLASTEIVMLRP
jgi:hypothetical protein